MVPPVTADLAPSTTIHMTKLDPTPQGLRAFSIKLPGILGPNLHATLKAANTHYANHSSWTAQDERQEALYEHIFNRLVHALEGHDDIIVRMHDECGVNGPLALSWLKNDIDPSSNASSIQKVLHIFKTHISDSSPITDMQKIVTINASLNGAFQLNPALLTVLLIAKIPKSLASARESIIQQDSLPNPNSLISKIKSSLSFSDAAAEASSSSTNYQDRMASSFAAMPQSKPMNKICFNCESRRK